MSEKLPIPNGTCFVLHGGFNSFKWRLAITSELKFSMTSNKPCWFHRTMMRLFFGWKVEDYESN